MLRYGFPIIVLAFLARDQLLDWGVPVDKALVYSAQTVGAVTDWDRHDATAMGAAGAVLLLAWLRRPGWLRWRGRGKGGWLARQGAKAVAKAVKADIRSIRAEAKRGNISTNLYHGAQTPEVATALKAKLAQIMPEVRVRTLDHAECIQCSWGPPAEEPKPQPVAETLESLERTLKAQREREEKDTLTRCADALKAQQEACARSVDTSGIALAGGLAPEELEALRSISSI